MKRSQPASSSSQVDVSILIVSYNTKELTAQCIESVLARTHDVSSQIIVVDNASSDGTVAHLRRLFPSVSVIPLADNIGFARANNCAARDASGRYILLLNPDTVMLDDAISRLVRFAEDHPEHGLYGGLTYFADGSWNPTSGWYTPSVSSLLWSALGISRLAPGSTVFNSESMRARSPRLGRPLRVDIVSGCFLLLRRSIWDDLAGFDTRFDMYAEDADLSIRAAKSGLSPVIFPGAKIVHYGGASERVKADKISRLFRAKVKLFHKHWNPASRFLGLHVLLLNAAVRVVGFSTLYLLGQSSADSVRQWRAIWRRRSDWMSTKCPL